MTTQLKYEQYLFWLDLLQAMRRRRRHWIHCTDAGVAVEL